MKKIGIVLAVFITLTLITGCASSGGSSDGAAKNAGADVKPYSVDLTKLLIVLPEPPKGTEAVLKGSYKTQPGVKNITPFASQYADFLLLFPQLPDDITKYKRVTIDCKYFDEKGAEIAPSDGKAMVSLIYDVKGDLRGPDMGPGKNTPLKEMNIGGYSGLVNKDKGTRISLNQPPQAILFQNSDLAVKFIQVTQITFHNSTASGAE